MAVQKDINEALMNDILAIYSDAEDKMLKAVAKRVAKGIKEEGWNEKKLAQTQALKKEIEKIINDTQKLSNAKISEGIIDAYTQGKAEVGGVPGVHKTILDELDIPMNLKMQVLATNNLLDNASFQVLRKADDAYQKVMAHATTGLLAGTDTRRQTSQKMLNEFASKGITTFVDKAGRNWDLSSYAEMAARTVGSHAALQGHIDRQVEVGEDLVKVSTIGTTCPICQRWQGVVLSISGNSPKYHSVEEARASGLFHPNCKHTLLMFIPDLDGEGKVEPEAYNPNTQSSKQYYEIQKQRANERSIRYWKKRRALAITPEQQKFCNDKVKAWQYKNLLHCEKHGLRRNYAREGVMTGNAQGPMGTFIGGNLKEYEQLYKDIIGQAPKPLFMKLNLQFFSQKDYEKWLKEEIQSLDDLDIDKAMMKDANNKNVTPTSLYKKYIGDNPAQDYAEVSEYEKGTKEYKTGYAKWLKQQIEDIGVTYKIKPKYVEVHEDIPDEDKKLSATEIYKKYHEGEKPTEAYKKLGGEAGTGMAYGKWVETQKKELIKNGITKTVPFENATSQKTANVISQAKSTIDNAKIFDYMVQLKNEVHGAYDGYLKVKEQKEAIDNGDTSATTQEKFKLAKQKHLEFVKKKAEKNWGSKAFDDDLMKLTNMLLDETDAEMHKHIDAQIQAYNEVKKQKEDEIKAQEEAKKKAAEAAAKAKAAQALKSGKVTLNRRVRFDEGKPVQRGELYQQLSRDDLENLSSQVAGHNLFSESRRDILGRDSMGRNHHMGHDVRLKSGLTKAEQELGEAFKIAYNDYFNTIKCNDINLAYLRGYENASPTMKSKIDAINKCIQSVELSEPIVLHRYVDGDLIDALFKTKDVHSLRPGSLHENNTFMSTSTGGHPTFGKRDYMITLQVDKGTHALPTINHEELEVLLGKGKLEVVTTNKYTSRKPYKLTNYDGSDTKFVGDEVVVRYIEESKAIEYEKPTAELINEKLNKQTGSDPDLKHHTDDEHTAWKGRITAPERSSVVKYTGSYYRTMNRVLRDDEFETGSDSTADTHIKNAQAGLRKASLDKPIILKRGMGSDGLSKILGGDGTTSWIEKNLDTINKGDYVCEDKGFLSMTPVKSGGFSGNVEVRMYCPAGTHAAYVAPISNFSSERETLLQSGSVCRVVKIEKVGSSSFIAYLELLGTD